MCAKCLILLATISVLLCFHVTQTQIPIYDIHVDNLLKMQQGIGWPVNLRVVKGHEALMRLTTTLENMQGCEVTTPAGLHFDVHHPPNSRYEYWGDGCGLRVKNVEEGDQGRWRLTMTAGSDNLTGWTDMLIQDDISSYTPKDPITLQDGKTHTDVNLTTLENSYCVVTQPFTESSLVPGHCHVVLDRTTRAVQGKWDVVLGLPGKVSELHVERTVAVQAEQLSSGYKEENSKLHLYCNILHTEKNITFCRFQKNTATVGLNIMDGLSDGHYSYYGDGFAQRQCGMTIEAPAANDYVVWRCAVGLQEWSDNQIKQSPPMQALFKVSPHHQQAGFLSESLTLEAEAEDKAVFVQKTFSFTIMCRAEESLAYCWFQHPNGTTFTPVERQSDDDNERDFWYTGESLQYGDCGITFAHASDEDAGEWICHMGPRNTLGVEVTDKVPVRVTGPLAANKKDVDVTVDAETTLYCHTSNGHRPLDYCRFLSPNYVGISIDSSVTAENAILGRFYFTPERSLDYGDCSLTIKSVLQDDIGNWTCAALLHDGTEEAWDTMTVYISSGSHQPLTTASIVGMSFGFIVLVVILIGTLWYKKGRPIPWRRTTVTSEVTDASFHIRENRASSTISSGSDNSNQEPQIRIAAFSR